MKSEHVPTVAELVKRGLAYPLDVRNIKGRKSHTVYRISAEGMQLMKDAMRRNAEAALARGEGEWEQPPSRDDLG